MASGTPHIAFKEQDIIANKYRLVRELGKGGMGAVWEATHIEMGTRKAIKFMLANPSELSSESIERFRREAIAAGQLTSEYVIKAQDIDTLPSGELYIVMEYVEGKPLDKVLKEQGPLPLDLAAMYTLQVCKALQQAHRFGIVHRDLKPPNFLLSSDAEGRPCIKVFDFGIAKVTAPLTTAAEADLTRTSEVMGTPFYMAPEHFRSMKELDARADIWALGVILYEVITGVRPFRGSDVGKIAVAVCTQSPEPPSRIYPAIPKEFDRIVLRCLEKEPENRFQSAEELAKALMPFAADPARFAVSVGLPLPLADTDRPSGAPPAAIPPEPRRVTEALTGPNPAPPGPVAPTFIPLPDQSPAPKEPPSNSKSMRSMAIGAVVGIAVILGIAILILTANRSEAESDSAPQQIEPPPAQLSADPAPPASAKGTAQMVVPTVTSPISSQPPIPSNIPTPSSAKPNGSVAVKPHATSATSSSAAAPATSKTTGGYGHTLGN